jgi:hypothetical protein
MSRLTPLLMLLLVAAPLSREAAGQSDLPVLPAPGSPSTGDRIEQILNGPVNSAPVVASPGLEPLPSHTTGTAHVQLESIPPPVIDPSIEFQVGVGEADSEDEIPAGGEIRWRYLNERGRLRAGDPRQRNTAQLWRTLIDAELGTDVVEFRGTYIDAASFGEELPDTIYDQNRSDLLQLFGDLRLLKVLDSESRIRIGRQFLDYGSQRFVSRLDWANTYRNFEGGRLYTSNSTSSLDAFLVRPVNAAAGSPVRSTSRDHADQSAVFSGLYSSTSTELLGAFDLFWFFSEESEPQPDRHDGSFHTLGGRWNLELPIGINQTPALTWLVEIEGAGQFGRDNFVGGGAGQNVSAGAVSAVGGIRFDQAPGKLTVKGISWIGSGDDDPLDGTINTWHLLYPDSHTYWGQIDNLSGSNLSDLGVQATITPWSQVTFDVQWHRFQKTRADDFVYDVDGLPIAGTSTTPGDIGSELDLVLTLGEADKSSLQIGYFWFWYDEAITSQPSLDRPDAGQFYVMMTSRF